MTITRLPIPFEPERTETEKHIVETQTDCETRKSEQDYSSYKVVQASHIKSLQDIVHRFLQAGFIPEGGAFESHNGIWSQTLIRNKEEADKILEATERACTDSLISEVVEQEFMTDV